MRKRRWIIGCVLLCLFLSGCRQNAQPSAQTQPPLQTQPQTAKEATEIHAVWISYLDLAPAKGCSEDAFRAMAKEMIEKIGNAGLNTVFLHVRPFSDAIYRSTLFPYSAWFSGTEGKDPGFDALQVFCDCAADADLGVHAWINPLRVDHPYKLDERSDANPAKRILRDNDPENDSRVVEADGTLYYDPTNKENQDMIRYGVRELLTRYPIDGVHIDDYFYPSTDLAIDQKEYDDYFAHGGTESRDHWRRAQIDALVAGLYTCVKSFGEDKIFSISPAMQIEKNRTTYYADVQRWAANDGYCDWLIPQVYVGFKHETYPFSDVVKQWTSIKRSPNVRLMFGLAAYKSGDEDAYAGSGRNEWIDETDILARQIELLRKTGECSGFALFSYSYIFGGKMSDNSKSEIDSVISVL